jgi:hypothetical protein
MMAGQAGAGKFRFRMTVMPDSVIAPVRAFPCAPAPGLRGIDDTSIHGHGA